MIGSLSLRRKMMLVVMTTTLVALLASATALLAYELLNHRGSWTGDLQTQADLVAQSAGPALAFDDARVGTETLQLLRLRPQIELAALYDANDRLFAAYVAPGQQGPAGRLALRTPGQDFNGDQLEVRRAVAQGGDVLGTLVLRARYDVMPRLRGYLAILVAVMLASLALAALLAGRLQRTVTAPIVAVADVARDVVQQRNYALRAPKTTTDEVGALVDAFNDMLGELGGQADALRAADRRKDEFLATLAHELRNPLAPLRTALSLLSRDDADAAVRHRMQDTMRRQLDQLVRLVDDLLDVSRVSTGRLTLRPETLDVVQVVRDALDSVAATIRERGHALAVDWPAAPPWVHGDATRLAQVFVNLLNNAARYTDPGGRIGVAFAVQDGSVEVSVTDTGIGIDPAMHGAVFEIFVQVDRSLERGRAGLGVGLALSRQLVELHGGTVTLRSPGLGHGSVFTVCLPTVRRPAVPTPAPPAEPAGPPSLAAAGNGLLRILMADDNRDFVDSMAAVLEGEGHAVRVVYDGKSALAAILAEMPDVALLDVGMPGLNGYNLASAVRAQRPDAGVLLVAITGWGQAADQRRASDAGFDHHFVKPVEVDDLLQFLAQRARPLAAAADPARAGG